MKNFLYSLVGEIGCFILLVFIGIVWKEKKRKILVLNELKKLFIIKV